MYFMSIPLAAVALFESTYNTAPGIRDFTTSWSELIPDSNQIKTHYWAQVALHLGLTQFRGWYGLKTQRLVSQSSFLYPENQVCQCQCVRHHE
jgi:hypothetical protein